MGGGNVVLRPRIFFTLKEGRRKGGREGGMEKQNKKKDTLIISRKPEKNQ